MAFKLGTEEAAGKKNWLSLRTGRLCLTSSDELPGYKPAYTENKSGEKTHFFAKEFESVAAYVDDMRWHVKEFDNGAKTSGWNIALNTGDSETSFMFTISDKERPFNRLMSALASCDFTQPVKLVGFKGRDGNKVLLVYQDDTPGAKPVSPKYQERWLSQDLIKKLKAGQPLSDDEKQRFAYDAAGNIVPRMTYDDTTGELSKTGFPYITQSPDGKWSTAVWTVFLKEKMEQDVIPAIKAAAAQRLKEGAKHLATGTAKSSPTDPYGDFPEGPAEPEDDVIPF